MAKTRGDLLSTGKGKIVGKHQLYALLTDASGNAILNAAGDEQLIEVQADANGKIKTLSELNGSLPKSEMEGYGATVATRPLATAVPIGYAFMSVTTQEIWQSDGTNWVVV